MGALPRGSHEARGGKSTFTPCWGRAVSSLEQGRRSQAGTCLVREGWADPPAIMVPQSRGDLDGSEPAPLCQWDLVGKQAGAGIPSGGSLRLPEGRASQWESGQEPWGARRGCSAGGSAWGRGRQRPEGQWDGPARGWGHVLVCQGYCFGVGRGDHEADPGGADGVSCAVGHFPKVSAVPLQGVEGSAADLALGDRNRSQQHGRSGTPPSLLPASPTVCPLPETHVPAPPCPQHPGTEPCLLRQPRRANSHSGRE